MLRSTYSYPRGLVFVSTGGFYPKITGIALLKNEWLKWCRAWGAAGAPLQPGESGTAVAVVAAAIGRGKSGRSSDATKKKSQSELLEILASPEDAMRWIHVGI